MTYRYQITQQHQGVSVGQYLKREHGFSSRALTKLKGYPQGLLLEGEHIRTVDRLSAGQTLTVTFLEEKNTVLPSNKKVPILYEDQHLLIYNKPPGMPVHTTCSHATDTLENVYATHCRGQTLSGTLRAVNRLDRDTSGCVLCAKNRYVASQLKAVGKTYQGLVVGRVIEDGLVDGGIFRPDPVSLRRVVDPRGQQAVTHYKALFQSAVASLLEFSLENGRTHQIRVHMQSMGHPMLGDRLYGERSPLIERQALHCTQLWFSHPITGARVEVVAPLPEDIKKACREIFGGEALC